MSKTIDERVVSMQFDNGQFEKNVSASIKSVDNLKKSLNFDGVSKGLDDVSRSTKGVDMSSLGSAVETVRTKFSALQVMAVTALANISNSAVNAGKRLVSAFTIEPISTGFNEFELKMGSVQTIMASTGESLGTVNKYLEELNLYSDKTIYSFSDMTTNIGKFTNAGVKLEDAVAAIKGVSNEAAVSGANANEASRAMYNFAQALSAGYVKLIDWKSIENANMATVEFKQQLIDTGLELGTLVKVGDKYKTTTTDANGKVSDLFDSTSNFNEALSNQWMTSEVLITTLGKYADETTDIGKKAYAAAQDVKTFSMMMDTLKEAAQSGWAQTWEILVGDFEEGKKLWTDLSEYFGDLISKSAEARNNVLQGWKDKGGRTMAIDAIKNAFDGLLSVLKPIKEAFNEVFPPMTAKRLLELTARIKEFTSKLKLSSEQAEKVKSIFKGVFSTVKIGLNIIKNIIVFIGKVFKSLSGLHGSLLNAGASLGDWITGVSDSVSETNIFGKVLDKIVNIIRKVIDVLGKGIAKLKEFAKAIRAKIETKGFQTFLGILNAIWSGIKKVGLAVAKVMGTIGNAIGEAFRNGDIKSLIDIINGGIITGILLKIKKWANGLKSSLGFIDSIKAVLSSVQDSLVEWQKNIKADTLLKIAAAIAILVAALWVLSGIDQEKLTNGLFGITILFIELTAVMKAFEKVSTDKKGAGKAATMMIGMSVAVLILASAMKKLSVLDWDGVLKGLVAIIVLSSVLVGAMALLSKVLKSSEKIFSISKDGLFSSKNEQKLVSVGLAMIAMAAALKILASACVDLGSLDWGQLARGLVGVIGLMAVAAGAMIALSKFAGSSEKIFSITKKGIFSSKNKKNLVSVGIALIAMAAAMKIFASAAKDFADISWEGLGKAGAAIAGILVLVVGFNKLCDLVKGDMSKNAASLIILGVAMEIFANVCKKFGSMEWEALGKAGAAIAGILLLAAGFALLAGMSNKMAASAASLILIGIAMELFANICKKFGSMEWEALGKAGVAIAGILALAAGFALLAGMSNKMAASAASLILIGIAMAILTPILKSLGSMSWRVIAAGLIALAGAFAVIGLAGKFLEPVVPAILKLSIAMAIFGVGVAIFAAGVLALTTVTAAGATAIVAALHIIIIGILELIPSIVGALTDAVLALCEVFIKCVPAIGKAIYTLIIEIVKILVECIPTFVDGVLQMIVGVLDGLVKYMPTIVDKIFQFLIALLEGVARNLPALIQAVVDVVMALCTGVIDALKSIDPDILVKGLLSVGFISAIMVALSAMSALAPAAMAGVVGFGLVIGELALVLAALGKLSEIPGLEKAIDDGGGLLQKVGTAIGKFVGGIAGGLAEGVTASLPAVGKNLSSFMKEVQPFIEGAKSIDPTALEGVKSLVDIILALTGANIIDAIGTWLTGESALDKFGEQIAEFGPNIKAYADSVSGINASAVEASVTAAKCLSELAHNLPNSGGLLGAIVGENDIGVFGEQLIPFAEGMKTYSDTIVGFNSSAVISSAEAATALAEMAKIVPNEGGVVAWFTGENSISKFGNDLVDLGKGLKDYSDTIVGLNSSAIISSVEAATALAEMAKIVPNEGGVAAWFAGENSISKFGFDLVQLATGLKSYSDIITGFNSSAVIASTDAAKSLAEMTATIPNEGGVVAWFTGENSIAKFASQLPTLGVGLLAFSTSMDGINAENLAAGTSAAKSLADMASVIPNEGGVVAWFAGDNSIANFASQLPLLGSGLLNFSTSVTGVNASAVTAAATAAKSLAEMTTFIPNEGGLKSWFSGESGVAAFAANLPLLGLGLFGFAAATAGITAESVTAAATAAKSLAEMTTFIPTEGGLKSWFSGESGVAAFAANLPLLGLGLFGFAAATAGITAESVTAAATAAKSLAEMTTFIPTEGGLKAWFSGESGVATFSENLPKLGDDLKQFSDSVYGIEAENVTAAAKAAKDLAEMSKTAPDNTSKLISFGTNLNTFGEKLKTYFETTSNITPDAVKASNDINKAITSIGTNADAGKLKTLSESIKTLTGTLKECSKIKESSTSGFVNAVKRLGTLTIDEMVKTFNNGSSEMVNCGKNLISKFIDGLNNKGKSINDACAKLVSKCASGINDKYKDFKSAGSYLVEGFANGISASTWKAEAKARAMAKAAEEAAKSELDSHSPSRVFEKIGKYVPEGFARGIDKLSWMAKDSSKIMADGAIEGTKNAISRIADAVNSDIDAQPVISPVLDLSDVKSGAAAMNSLFSTNPSVGVLSNVGTISTMMNRRSQNGANDDVISAIDGLRKELGNVGNTSYNINGITYDDGSNITEAIRTIVRAAKVERRV